MRIGFVAAVSFLALVSSAGAAERLTLAVPGGLAALERERGIQQGISTPPGKSSNSHAQYTFRSLFERDMLMNFFSIWILRCMVFSFYLRGSTTFSRPRVFASIDLNWLFAAHRDRG